MHGKRQQRFFSFLLRPEMEKSSMDFRDLLRKAAAAAHFFFLDPDVCVFLQIMLLLLLRACDTRVRPLLVSPRSLNVIHTMKLRFSAKDSRRHESGKCRYIMRYIYPMLMFRC